MIEPVVIKSTIVVTITAAVSSAERPIKATIMISTVGNTGRQGEKKNTNH